MTQPTLTDYSNDESTDTADEADNSMPAGSQRTPASHPAAEDLPHLFDAPGPVDGTATMWLLGIRYTDGALVYLNPAPRSNTDTEFEHYAYRRPQIRSIEPYNADTVLKDDRNPRRQNRYEDTEQPHTLADLQEFIGNEYWSYQTEAVTRLTERAVLTCEDYPTDLTDVVDSPRIDGGHLLGTTSYNAGYYVTDAGDQIVRYLELRDGTFVRMDASRRHKTFAHHRLPTDSQVWRGKFIAQVHIYPDGHGWTELTDVGNAHLSAYLDHAEDSIDALSTLAQ